MSGQNEVEANEADVAIMPAKADEADAKADEADAEADEADKAIVAD
jgi:hypothetical protein